MSDVYSHQLDVPRRGGVPWVFPAILALSLLAIASVGYAWSSNVRTKRSATADYASLEQRLSENQERLSQAEDTNAQLRGQLNVIAQRLQLTPVEQAEARRLAGEFRRMNGQQLAQLDAGLRGELNTKANGSDLKEVSNRSASAVADVRTDINNAKSELQATLNEMNKLVARNQHEIAMLRSLGQRTDYDFVLDGKTAEKTVAGVTIQLKDSNVKKNEFTVTLAFGKTRVVKKNGLLGEPIYFYMPGETAPRELVVNQVEKHRVAGRLTVLKSPVPPTTAASVPASAAAPK